MTKSTREKKFAANSAIYTAFSLLGSLSTFVILPFLTAQVSQDAFGVVEIAVIISMLAVPLMTLQAYQGMYRYLCETADFDDRRAVISSSAALMAGAGAVSSLLLALALLLLGSDNIWLIVLLGIARSTQLAVANVARGFDRPMVYAVQSLLSAVIMPVVAVPVILMISPTAQWIIAAYIAAQMLSALYGIIRLKIWRYIAIKGISRSMIRKLLRFSIPFVPELLLAWVIANLSRVTLDFFAGASQVGVISIANRIPEGIAGITYMLGLAWLDVAIREYKSRDRSEFYSASFNGVMKLSLLAVAMGLPLTKLVMPLLTSGNFPEAYQLVPPLLFGVLFDYYAVIFSASFHGAEKTGAVFYSIIAAAVLSAVLAFTAVPALGVWGAVLSVMLCRLVMCAARVAASRRYVKVAVDWRSAAWLVLLNAICVFFYYACDSAAVQIAVFAGAAIAACVSQRKLLASIIGGLGGFLKGRGSAYDEQK